MKRGFDKIFALIDLGLLEVSDFKDIIVQPSGWSERGTALEIEFYDYKQRRSVKLAIKE